jgi:acetylornithine deacetylase/succinyl-diaminopimelate desuccinylase-like protein
MNNKTSASPLYERPAELLQQLIRFDTTNPPGREVACIAYLNDLLTAAGIETTMPQCDPERPTLVARLRGRGDAPPLLLYGHVDVVTTTGQKWQHPPFDGAIVDGYLWGRGALDMKSGVAMYVAALLRAQAEGIELPGDVILAVVPDEEAGGVCGARFLVEQHAELFEGVRYALGEFGGFTIHIGKQRFYPIAIAEKQICSLRATVRGPAGHGSMPLRGGAMAKLARLIRRLEQHRLPVHVTPAARLMVEALAGGMPAPANAMLRQVLNPALTDRVLDLLGSNARLFDPLLHNTASATIVRGGDKINVIPCEVTLGVDGRLLPGYAPADMLAELRRITGEDVEWEVEQYEPGPPAPDMALFETLAGVLRAADPAGIPAPFMLSGVTDARFFCKLGIQTYGFTPMQLPASFDFSTTIHAADERVPVEAVAFGAEAVYKVLQQQRQ